MDEKSTQQQLFGQSLRKSNLTASRLFGKKLYAILNLSIAILIDGRS